MMAENYFSKLFSVNVSDKIEKKNGLSYVSWCYAWAEVKKMFPDATYTVYENKDGWFYHTDGKTCWVKTGLTVNGIEHIEMLPVMDFKNRSIPLENVTSMDVNKAIQRSLTKAAARHGLGLYVYAGEDLPEDEAEAVKQAQTVKQIEQQKPGNVEIDIIEKVPELPKEPEAEPSESQKYLLSAMKQLRIDRGITAAQNNKLFATQLEKLVQAGLTPNKKLEEYSLDEAVELIDLMYKRFTPEGTELK